MFLPALTSWRAQYARLVRGFERLSQPIRVPVDYEDDLFHFLQDCWHLKDWLNKDPSSGVGSEIEHTFTADPILRVVGDLANAAKHMVRTKHNRAGANIVSNDVDINLGTKEAKVTYHIKLSDGTHFTEKELIQKAKSALDAVLEKLGLDPHQ